MAHFPSGAHPDVRYILWIRNPRDCIVGKHITDNLSDWGVACPPTHDTRLHRAVSWKYQYDLVCATPRPRNWIEVWRDNQDEKRATIRMRIDVATEPRVA